MHRPIHGRRRRSSSLSAILDHQGVQGEMDEGNLSDHHLGRRCRPPHDKRATKKRCSRQLRESPTKCHDAWSLREPLGPSFTFPPNCSFPLTSSQPVKVSAFAFVADVNAFQLASTTASSSSSSSTRLRNGSLGSTSSSFADESSSSPSTSASSVAGGWPAALTSISPSAAHTSPPPPDGDILMDCDDDDDGPSFTGLDEVTRLHHEAFESLRTSTQTEEEDFLVRLRRWEEEKQEQARELSVSPTSMPPRAPPCSPQGPVARKSRDSGVGLDEVEEDECMLADQEEDEDDDDINIVLSSSPSPIKMATGSAHDARGRSRPGRLNLEVEELSRKLKNGAGLEDYRLVREYQERGRTGSRDSAASGGW